MRTSLARRWLPGVVLGGLAGLLLGYGSFPLLLGWRVEAVASARGAGAVVGTVLDTEGAPVSGVVVRAVPLERGPYVGTADELGATAPVLDLDRELREAFTRHAERAAGMLEGRSDQDGTFRLEGAGPGRYSISAFADGSWVGPRRGRTVVVAGEFVELEARRLVDVPVEVLTPDGLLADDAVLVFGDGNLPSVRIVPVAWSATRPVLRLPAGPLDVAAVRGPNPSSGWIRLEDADLASERVHVEVSARGETPPLVLSLQQHHGVRGRVSSGLNPHVFWGMEVYLAWLADGEVPDAERLRASELHQSVVHGNEYTFSDLRPGRYAVGLARDHEGPVEAVEIAEVGDGFARLDLVLPAAGSDEALDVRVTSRDGAWLEDATFLYSVQGGLGGRGGYLHPAFEDGGRVRLELPAHVRSRFFDLSAAVPGEHHWLRVEHPLHGARIVELEPGTRTLDVALDGSVDLEVRLVAYERSGLEGRLELKAARIPPDGARSWFLWEFAGGELDASGASRFPPLEPGRYRVVLSRAPLSPRDTARTLLEKEVSLEPGRTELRLVTPTLQDVEIALPPDETLSLQLIPLVGHAERSHVDRRSPAPSEPGSALFRDVVAGRYELRVSSRSQRASLELEVPCGPLSLVRGEGGYALRGSER